MGHFVYAAPTIVGVRTALRPAKTARANMSEVFDRHPSKLMLLSMKQLSDRRFASAVPPDLLSVYQLIAQWLTSYLMRPHPELGRPGDVCPFTAQALRLDAIRIGVSSATSSDVAAIRSCMRYCFEQLASVPCPESMVHFRTIIVGFPEMDDAAGLESLRKVQSRLKILSLLRGLMIGRFHAGSKDPGLWNRDFRPLRSPIPLLAIRQVVENDAAFAMRHPLLIPTYVWKYSLAAPKRLLANLARGR
jgi:hypothetical protein